MRRFKSLVYTASLFLHNFSHIAPIFYIYQYRSLFLIAYQSYRCIGICTTLANLHRGHKPILPSVCNSDAHQKHDSHSKKVMLHKVSLLSEDINWRRNSEWDLALKLKFFKSIRHTIFGNWLFNYRLNKLCSTFTIGLVCAPFEPDLILWIVETEKCSISKMGIHLN